jgi:hypothetical protein
MPFSHRIDRDQGVIVTRLWGVVTSEQLDEHRRAVLMDPAFDPGFRLLADMRGLTTLDIPSDRIRYAAERSVLRGGRHRAIVAASPEQYGVARMYATWAQLAGDWVEVFRDWESAARWLGLDGALAADPGIPPAL